MKKLTEIEKLKYWLDGEITILHIMFAVLLWQLTEGWLPHLFIAGYIVFSSFYAIVRIAVIATQDKDYLRVPKK